MNAAKLIAGLSQLPHPETIDVTFLATGDDGCWIIPIDLPQTLVDAGAKAICALHWGYDNWDHVGRRAEIDGDVTQDGYRDMVRAVISAIGNAA